MKTRISLWISFFLMFTFVINGVCGTYLYTNEKGETVVALPTQKNTDNPAQPSETENKDQPPAGIPYKMKEDNQILYDKKK